jgi:putative pyoverdin transport system ATP-binding/permease protein
MSLMSDSVGLLRFLNRWSRSVRNARLLMAALIALGIVSGLANTGLLALMNSALSRQSFSDPRLIYGFVALCVLLPLSRFVSGFLLLKLAADAVFHLRLNLTRSLLTVPFRRLEEHGPHRVLNVLTEDIGAITQALTALPTLCMQTFIVISSLAYLGYLSWQILLMLLVVMALGLASYRLPTRIAMGHLQDNRGYLDTLMKSFRAVTEGVKELRMHQPRREAFFSRELEAAAKNVRRTSVAANVIFVGVTSWGQILFFLLIGLVLFALPAFRPTDMRVLIGYCLVILYMMTPLESIMNTLPTLGRAAASMHKVEQMGLLLADGGETTTPVALPGAAWGRLELRGVTHSYQREGEAGRFTLGPINLAFEPGELVFLTGGNGSGKTTLAKLLTGLYVPEGGEIVMGSQAVDDQNREWYRQHFSAVFADFFLFDKLLGIEGADLDERAKEQIARLKLEHKVTVRNGELSTVDLSQGQRKRLALLTAYLEDRPLYLFDEWAADQDPFFKEVFYLQLLPHLKASGKTVIVISHDDRYYGVADRVVKLEYGQVQFDRRTQGVVSGVDGKALAVS